jgi:hypothetical protein
MRFDFSRLVTSEFLYFHIYFCFFVFWAVFSTDESDLFNFYFLRIVFSNFYPPPLLLADIYPDERCADLLRSAWLGPKELSRLTTAQIDAFVADSSKKEGDLMEGYRKVRLVLSFVFMLLYIRDFFILTPFLSFSRRHWTPPHGRKSTPQTRPPLKSARARARRKRRARTTRTRTSWLLTVRSLVLIYAFS